ncbi:MAG TPA: HupE/UreJ family protein [Candidatus Acidoferrum sp.]
MNSWIRKGARICATAALVATFPATAEAHLNATGMGPIYDGAAHFFMSPEDLVPVLAFALLAGLRGVSYGRRAMFVLPCAWLLGGLIGLSQSPANGSGVITAIWFLLLGGLLAANIKLPMLGTTVLAALLGLYSGYLNGTGLGQPAVAVLALLGLVASVFVVIALVAAFVVTLRADWTRIAVRVAGSWTAASGLLMLGWVLRAR